MIDNALINSARLIKNDYQKLTSTLSTYENDVKNLANYFFKVSSELKNMGDEVTKADTIESIKDKVMLKLNDLEKESNTVSGRITEINEKIEKLKKEETDLYNIIKRRYPSMSDDEIRQEIQSKI
jgi:chromosome segregation ATPase